MDLLCVYGYLCCFCIKKCTTTVQNKDYSYYYYSNACDFPNLMNKTFNFISILTENISKQTLLI